MRSHGTTTTEFIIGMLMLLAMVIATFIWAHAAWLEHYA